MDQIGHLDAAIERARVLAKIPQARLITYREDGRRVNNIYSDFSSQAPRQSEFNLPSLQALGTSVLPAGFYYLWPMALPR